MYFDSLQGWLSWQEGLHPQVIDLGLKRVAKVNLALNPNDLKPPTVTVAGTNGKGSCIAFLEAIYRSQGYRVGSYTSPHLLKYNERIKINGMPVADRVICEAFERIESVRGEVSLSYFEFGTLAALDIFRHSGLDVQLLEVGLGGRLDAVNIVDADVTVITSICIDHCDWLGETREAIGREKAGIFRSGVFAVIGDPDPPESLLQCADTLNSPMLRFGKNFYYQKKPVSWDWITEDRKLINMPLPGLKGEHQFRNAATVITAVNVMNGILPVNEESIQKGLQEADLKGRFQLIEDDIPVLLDVAHNPQAVRALADYLHNIFPGRKIHAVFSMMKDKDIKGVIEIMQPLVAAWYVAPLSNPRTASTKQIFTAFVDCHVDNVSLGFEDFSKTFAAAKENAQAEEIILVFGSFFLVSEYLAVIEEG
jgi:dihydrofolate synthase / folylpolyglutamate synthase